MSEVGREVKRLREARGWIQAKLAVEAGMAPSAVNQIENGKRSPSANSLNKLARALGVEVADLFPKGQAPLPLDSPSAEEYAGFLQAENERVRNGGKPRAHFVPLQEGEEPDVVMLQLHYVRLLEENDRLLQEVTRLRDQLEKAGRGSA